MKKIVYLLMVLGFAFVGCNPNEDINNDIDAQGNPIKGNDAFLMSSDDYANIVDQGSDDPVDYYEMYESFSNIDDAKLMLPPFLANRYPYWGEGSSVTVSFNVYDGNPGDDLSGLTNAASYLLASDDYPTAASNAFFPTEDANPTLTNVLATQFPSPTEDDVVRIQYKRFNEIPVTGQPIVYDGLFPDVFATYENLDVTGTQGWTEGSSYAQGSGFESGAANVNEDWLISPEIDLTGEQDLQFQINQRISFLSGEPLANHMNILVSTDYTGDVTTATWDTITLTTVPDGTSSDFILSEDYDFSAYDGETINIAFKYESTASNAPLWRIDYFNIKALGITGETTTSSNYYKYVEGAWQLLNDVYYLTNTDYDSMGTASGQPGQYNNFSSSTSPENYLPAFLNIKYPFAQEEDEIFLVYKFYNGSTVTRGNLYAFTNGTWVPAISMLQFGYENGIWVPDNTIRYTLVGSDYSDVASALLTESGFEDAVANLDNYGNFNRTGGPSGGGSSWSNTMMERAMGIVLNSINPNAENGQKYLVTCDTYNGGNTPEEFKLIKTDGEWVLNTEG